MKERAQFSELYAHTVNKCIKFLKEQPSTRQLMLCLLWLIYDLRHPTEICSIFCIDLVVS